MSDPAAATQELPHAGHLVHGRYQIEQLAGSGGLGYVYRAKDLQNNSTVALKLLRRSEESERARFEREAHALASLSHPAIVRYLEHGVTSDGVPFLAMEWLEGEELATHLLHHSLSIEDTIALGIRLATALGVAHNAGIVHHDLKPGNVFLRGGNPREACLLDFGLVRAEFLPNNALTRTGTILGTPGYMAPEQARGAATLDPRVDVFSLGCLLYECLTGQPAFQGETLAALLSSVLLSPAPFARSLRPEVSPALDALLQRMLSKVASERPADGNAVAHELALLSAPTQLESKEGNEFSVCTQRTIHAPTALVYALASDTDRWNRIVGSPRTHYVYEPLDPQTSSRNYRVGTAELVGMPMRWIEWGEGIEGHWFTAERRFLSGPIARAGLRCSFHADANGNTLLDAKAYAVARAGEPEGPAEFMAQFFGTRIDPYLQTLEEFFSSAPAEPWFDRDDAPSVQARRLLLSRTSNRMLSGRCTFQPSDTFTERANAFAKSSAPAPQREALIKALTQAPDDHLRQMRPYEFALLWQQDERTVLHTFLSATEAGLLELHWELLCPSCRVSAAYRSRLEDIDTHTHCPECQIDFENDLATNIEAVFEPTSAVRTISHLAFCAASPIYRPHLTAQLQLSPKQTRSEVMHCPAGVYLLREPRLQLHTRVEVPAMEHLTLEVHITEHGIEAQAKPHERCSSVLMHNEREQSVQLQIERVHTGLRILRAKELLTDGAFQQHFSHEAPRAGHALSVSTMTFAQIETQIHQHSFDNLAMEAPTTFCSNSKSPCERWRSKNKECCSLNTMVRFSWALHHQQTQRKSPHACSNSWWSLRARKNSRSRHAEQCTKALAWSFAPPSERTFFRRTTAKLAHQATAGTIATKEVCIGNSQLFVHAALDVQPRTILLSSASLRPFERSALSTHAHHSRTLGTCLWHDGAGCGRRACVALSR